MNRFEQAALLSCLMEKMRARGSWSGETHIQKGTYFLQELAQVPLGFAFILYKHGPFSFDLRDALGTMRADQLIEIDVQPYPYGPRINLTPVGQDFRSHFMPLLKEYERQLDFVSQQLGDKRVADLERLATALWVSKERPVRSATERATELQRLKPHVSAVDSLESVRFVDSLLHSSE